MNPSELALKHFNAPPVDPFALAVWLGISISPTADTTAAPDRITLERTKYHPRLRFQAAHELVETLYGPETECEANRLTSQLLMPEEWFEADLAKLGPHLSKLTKRYQVSYEACVRRVCRLGSYIAAIVDNGKFKRRFCCEGFTAPTCELLDFELPPLQEAFTRWKKITGERTTAWPVKPIQNDIRRIILVTEVDEW